jgi:hypothetical protein
MKKLNLDLMIIMFALGGLAFVVACDKDGRENGDDTVAAPTALKEANITATGAELSWTSDAPGFEVSLNGEPVATLQIARYTLTGLAPETGYTWGVRARKGDTYSGWVSGSFTTLTGPPPAPTGLECKNITQTGAAFSWRPGVNAVSYELQVGADVYAVADTLYKAENLRPGAAYTWQVRAKLGDETFTAWATGAGFTTEMPDAGLPGGTVTFGDTAWTVASGEARISYDERNPYLEVRLFGTDFKAWGDFRPKNFQYPWILFYVVGANTEGRYTDDVFGDDMSIDGAYYHKGFIDLNSLFGTAKEDPDFDMHAIIGDYWVDVTVPPMMEFKSIAPARDKEGKVVTLVSGAFRCTVFETAPFINNEALLKKTDMKAEFQNLEIIDITAERTSVAPPSPAKFFKK